MRACYAKIYLEILRKNIKTIRSFLDQGTKLCVAVKADAYGHGAVEVSRCLESCGVDCLAVATVGEGKILRAAGIKLPILLLSYCLPSEMKDVAENMLCPFVGDSEYIECFDKAAISAGFNSLRRFRVHLAVDTGMGRVGCLPEEAADLAKKISSSKALSLGGMSTHFAVSDSLLPEDQDYTKKQLDAFTFAFESVRAAGINPGIRHCANSAAIFNLKESHFDMVRCGISAYGYYPGDITKEYLAKKGIQAEIEPFMAFCAKIVAIRDFKKDKSISYGRTWVSDSETQIALLPVGYADGLLRRFNSCKDGLKIAINGKNYPVCGRICMDQCMVNLGLNSGAKRWDEVVIFGPKCSGALQSAEDIADYTGTISYEICTAIAKRVPRVYI